MKSPTLWRRLIPPIGDALRWMASDARHYGSDNLAAFRKGDQSLPGKTFPLLPLEDQEMSGRFTVILDGQWRVRNLAAFTQNREARGVASPEFGVCPLPISDSGSPRKNARWVNRNFFVFPKVRKTQKAFGSLLNFGSASPTRRKTAKTCTQGGRIPVSRTVTQDPQFQNYLDENPLFRTFIEGISTTGIKN
jgi:multiple sugar transport system substrate-binding protein